MLLILKQVIQNRAYPTLVLLALASACSERAVTSSTTTLSSLSSAAIPGDDAPQLAHPGPYRVGIRSLQFSFQNADDISILSHVTGDPDKWNRQLGVDILYPAQVPADVPADAVYHGYYETGFTEVDGLPDEFKISGLAVRNATPASGRYPLVLVSHGLLNTPGVLSGITENLASKGYVVAVIDHRDGADEPATPLHLFARVLLNRSLDQQRVLDELSTLARHNTPPVGPVIDIDAIALLGFSMGGYGVLNHAGAGFDADGEALRIVPPELLAAQTEQSSEYQQTARSHIDAVVAFAPWGGKPGSVWSDSALANINAPLLMFAGDQDDVSDFTNGIQRIFDRTLASNRYMLVFRNAQHNLVQIPAPPAAHLDVVPWMTFEDPVWRRQRLLAVGAHFTTAFLDWHLKGDTRGRDFLDLPTVVSSDGKWPQPMTSNYSDDFADGSNGSENYWRGFKRRQAMGMEMHRLSAGQSR